MSDRSDFEDWFTAEGRGLIPFDCLGGHKSIAFVAWLAALESVSRLNASEAEPAKGE